MKSNKRIYLITFLFTVGGALFISFGLSLLYNLANSNIVYYVTVLPDILNVLIDLTETAIFAIAFSMLFYSAFRCNTIRTAHRVFWIYLGAALVRRLGDLSVALLLFGALDIADILNNVIFLLLDSLLGLIALLLAKARLARYRKEQAWAMSDSVLFQDTPSVSNEDTTDLYPFQKIISRENPLQFCSLVMGIILSAEKIFFRFLYDIDYGAPESATEVLIMIVFYASDILIGIVFYCVSVLVYHQLLRKKKQKTPIK